MSVNNLQKSPFDGIKRATDERIDQFSQETGKISQDNCTKIKVGNQVVGIVENGVFEKRIHGSRHFLRKPMAIAMDESSLAQASKLGAKIVKIIDLDTGLIYIVTIELIYKKGFRFNRGFGDQIGLTLNYWQCTNGQGKNLITSQPNSQYSPKNKYTNSNKPKKENFQPGLFEK